MPWQAFQRCSCCQDCVYLDGTTCAIHGLNRRLCDGACPDRFVKSSMGELLTDDERERCARLAAHPIARFPLLTLDEMRRLLWFQEYFGLREHQDSPRPVPLLTPQDYRAIDQFIHPDAA